MGPVSPAGHPRPRRAGEPSPCSQSPVGTQASRLPAQRRSHGDLRPPAVITPRPGVGVGGVAGSLLCTARQAGLRARGAVARTGLEHPRGGGPPGAMEGNSNSRILYY